MSIPGLNLLFQRTRVQGTPSGATFGNTPPMLSKESICLAILDRLAFIAIWLPTGALGIYAKAKILADDKQWRILAHTFHRASTFPAAAHFTRLERATLFSSDCVVSFAVVPLIILVVLSVLP